MKIAIIDYKAGNIKSVEAALKRFGCDTILTKDPQIITAADKVVFPGVGHAGAALEALHAAGLDTLIPALKQPVLGICLGMQMMCRRSEEGDTPCLGIFDAEVVKFRPEPSGIPSNSGDFSCEIWFQPMWGIFSPLSKMLMVASFSLAIRLIRISPPLSSHLLVATYAST